LPLFQFLWEGWSKVRRYLFVHCRRKYVERMLSLRRGECLRCGTCCSFMIRCPHLEAHNQCSIYEKRAIQCRLFPIDARDLRGRFSVCGYYFITPQQAAEEAAAAASCTQVQEVAEDPVEKEVVVAASARNDAPGREFV